MRSEASTEFVEAIEPANRSIHAITADLLQAIITRGDLDLPALQNIESALVTRLYLCIHRTEYDLQNKLLHVLHTTVTAISSSQRKVDRNSSNFLRSRDASASQTFTEKLEPPLISHDPLLTKVLCDGIAAQRSSAVTHHWVDFLLMTLPHFRNVLLPLLFPLIDCISARLQTFLDELDTACNTVRKGKWVASDANDADFAILMNALERLFVCAIDEAKGIMAHEEESANIERPSTNAEAAGGFLGFMSTALGTTDSPISQVDAGSKVTSLLLGLLSLLKTYPIIRRKHSCVIK